MSKKINHAIIVISKNNDGQKRITRSEQTIITGGNKEVHDHVTEVAIKFEEGLGNKSVNQISRKEYLERMSDAIRKSS